MDKRRQSLIIVVLVLVAVTFSGWMANLSGTGELDMYASLKNNFELFKKVYKQIIIRYVDEVDPEAFVKAGIKGMTGKLDPYTSFVEKEERENLKDLAKGKYGGVGLTISTRENYPTVVEPPFPSTPAAKARIREGDKIIEVDGKSTKGRSLSSVAKMLRGEPGTAVSVKIQRAGKEEPLEFRLIRDVIVIQDIKYSGIIKDDIGYIRLTRFSKLAGKQLHDAIKKLKQKGMEGLIFDLRSNPGGLLNTAVAVADNFISKGELIVYTKGRSERANRKYYASEEPILGDLPLVVLVNGVSASASEIVAGAVQDLDRGLVIGSRTYGKGLVQTLIPFDKKTGLRITTAKYYIPSGRLIQNLARLNRDEDVLIGEDRDLSSDTTKNNNNKVYHTESGRVVYGGGGIKPDIEIETPELSNFEATLIHKSMFFNFAVSYTPQIKQEFETIEITDTIINQFRNYLKEKEFDFKLEGEEELRQLKTIAQNNQYGPKISQHLNDIEKLIHQSKENEFGDNIDFIKSSLKEEIATKLLGSEGQVKASLEDDPALQTALEVLSNPKEYAMKLGK